MASDRGGDGMISLEWGLVMALSLMNGLGVVFDAISSFPISRARYGRRGLLASAVAALSVLMLAVVSGFGLFGAHHEVDGVLHLVRDLDHIHEAGVAAENLIPSPKHSSDPHHLWWRPFRPLH